MARKPPPFLSWPGTTLLLFLGTILHLLADMPTPAGSWKGLPVLFPLPYRFGGWGWIWWHNPYLINLLVWASLVVLGLRILERCLPFPYQRPLHRVLQIFVLSVLAEEVRFVVTQGTPLPVVEHWLPPLFLWVWRIGI